MRPSPAGRSRPALFDAAFAAYREARFGEALDLLARADTTAADPAEFLLYVRTLLRTDPAAAIAVLARHKDDLATQRDRNEALVLLGTAEARVGGFKSAYLALDRVRDSLDPDTWKDGRIGDELQYRTALTLWMERRLDEADATLQPLLRDDPAGFYVEALILHGAIFAARGEIEQQAATLLKALRVVVSHETPDVLHWAHVTAQIAYLAREMPSDALRAAAYENSDAVPWTDDLADLHFKTLKAVAWRHALDGDYLSAFRLLKRAGRVAPTEAWRAVALCDRAQLAQSLGERRFTEQELDEVSEVAERVQWRAVGGEERLALLLLAVLYAPTDAALALAYIARFQETGDRFDRLSLANDDRRAKAVIDYSLGYAYARLHLTDEAIAFLKDAWETFDAIGYDWRAACCAKEIAMLTNDPVWASRARHKIVPYPASWIATEIVATCESLQTVPSRRDMSEHARLTPAQTEVYVMLMDGVAIANIARDLHRSEFTVRNHIKVIFKAFGVNTRAALMRLRP